MIIDATWIGVGLTKKATSGYAVSWEKCRSWIDWDGGKLDGY